MNELKPNDFVECIDARESSLVQGVIYTVHSCEWEDMADDYVVKVKEMLKEKPNHLYFPKRFRRVNPIQENE
jgi:uncharacterized protein YeeX (DUF496 family)